jgi:hypothetical protein
LGQLRLGGILRKEFTITQDSEEIFAQGSEIEPRFSDIETEGHVGEVIEEPSRRVEKQNSSL